MQAIIFYVGNIILEVISLIINNAGAIERICEHIKGLMGQLQLF
jgi:hypothetical protein